MFAIPAAQAQTRSTGFSCVGTIYTYTAGTADNFAPGGSDNTTRSNMLSTQISKWTTAGVLQTATLILTDADGGLGTNTLPGSNNRVIYAHTFFIPASVLANGRTISGAELEITLKPRGAPMYTNAGVPGSHNDVIRMVGLYGSSQFPSIVPNSDQSALLGQEDPPWNVFVQPTGKTKYITIANPLWVMSTREVNFLVYYYSMVDYAKLRICSVPP
jgi:hypothetical protein